jgi:uncharacterized protein (TIGR02117 family)
VIRLPSRLAFCAALLGLAAGCLGPVAPLYPPGRGAPTEAIWVVDHGWHTGLVMERSAIPTGLLPEQDDFPRARYLELGWGDADFYQARDPGAWTALRAAVASRASVVHVVGLPAPPVEAFAGEIVQVQLSRAGFDALVRFVDEALQREGRPRAPMLGRGLYGTSAFYPARGRYHLFYTCNTWIAEALRAAGAPITPAYAITAGNLMWQVRRLP